MDWQGLHAVCDRIATTLDTGTFEIDYDSHVENSPYVLRFKADAGGVSTWRTIRRDCTSHAAAAIASDAVREALTTRMFQCTGCQAWHYLHG